MLNIYIQSLPKYLRPSLVYMIKEGREKESALLILLIFYKKKSQKSWDTIIGTPQNSYE